MNRSELSQKYGGLINMPLPDIIKLIPDTHKEKILSASKKHGTVFLKNMLNTMGVNGKFNLKKIHEIINTWDATIN